MQTLSNFHDFILCIISTLEARDSYTSHHSSRVAEMTEKICDLLNLPLDEKEVYKVVDNLLLRQYLLIFTHSSLTENICLADVSGKEE